MQERQLDACQLNCHPVMHEKPTIVLFRHDLRVKDNVALAEAARSGKPVIPVFLFGDNEDDVRARGAASRWWLHHSLKALAGTLERLGVQLIIRQGKTPTTVAAIAVESGADSVFWNRRYDPREMAVDRKLEDLLRAHALRTRNFDGQLLHEPSQLRTKSASYYKVFGPFLNALSAAPEPRDPVDAPTVLRTYSGSLETDRVEDVLPLPKPDWARGMSQLWKPGEDGAIAALKRFIEDTLDGYASKRDFPAHLTSLLSPHLAHGEITPFTIWATLAKAKKSAGVDLAKFRQEVCWREFCYHLQHHNADLERQNFQRAFDNFPWRNDKSGLRAWQRGATGYPIVDAGMRQLWQSGTMHNRVRMIAASFLTKHLMIDWREGERWFWDTLVDADPASNPGNWQWVAGSGADAAPYFRIFNPVLQGEKFDPKGSYVRAYLPELTNLPDRFIHQPWKASRDVLAEAGVVLGENYPAPIVDHNAARNRALAAYKSIRGAA